MVYSEREYLQDPTLQLSKRYDKINPELEGYERIPDPKSRCLSAEALKKMAEQDRASSLDLSDL